MEADLVLQRMTNVQTENEDGFSIDDGWALDDEWGDAPDDFSANDQSVDEGLSIDDGWALEAPKPVKSLKKSAPIKKAVTKPTKKPTTKKSVAKKPAATKKSVAKKPAAVKSVAKKPATKKSVAKKPAAVKLVAKPTATKKSVAKKPAATKKSKLAVATKKTVLTKPTAKQRAKLSTKTPTPKTEPAKKKAEPAKKKAEPAKKAKSSQPKAKSTKSSKLKQIEAKLESKQAKQALPQKKEPAPEILDLSDEVILDHEEQAIATAAPPPIPIFSTKQKGPTLVRATGLSSDALPLPGVHQRSEEAPLPKPRHARGSTAPPTSKRRFERFDTMEQEFFATGEDLAVNAERLAAEVEAELAEELACESLRPKWWRRIAQHGSTFGRVLRESIPSRKGE
jgi:histone H1/5